MLNYKISRPLMVCGGNCTMEVGVVDMQRHLLNVGSGLLKGGADDG